MGEGEKGRISFSSRSPVPARAHRRVYFRLPKGQVQGRACDESLA
jgi:hypothetical protein